MELPEGMKVYRISGDIKCPPGFPDCTPDFYVPADDSKQAFDRFILTGGVCVGDDKGEVRISAVPLEEIPKKNLEKQVLKYYPDAMK